MHPPRKKSHVAQAEVGSEAGLGMLKVPAITASWREAWDGSALRTLTGSQACWHQAHFRPPERWDNTFLLSHHKGSWNKKWCNSHRFVFFFCQFLLGVFWVLLSIQISSCFLFLLNWTLSLLSLVLLCLKAYSPTLVLVWLVLSYTSLVLSTFLCPSYLSLFLLRSL